MKKSWTLTLRALNKVKIVNESIPSGCTIAMTVIIANIDFTIFK